MRRLAIVLAVLALAGSAVGWWLRPRTPQNPSINDAAPARAGTAAVGAVSIPVARLMLEVNDAGGAEIRTGESVFFTVSLSGTSATPGFRLGRPGRPWSTDLRFETAADGKPFPLKIEQLGSPVSYRPVRERQTPTPGAPEQADEAVVDASRVHWVTFGVSPDEAARLAAGIYDVRAVLNLTAGPAGVTLLESNTVSVRLQPIVAGAQPSPAEEKARLEAAARFYLQSGKWQDAHRIALQLAERENADALAFTLLADALNGLRRDDEALAAYRDALALLPQPLTESPDYLFARIEEVEQRLEAAKGKK
jgi:hypothetical protein